MRIAFIGPFGMEPKSTMRVRALPLAKALARRGHQVALFLPPFHTPSAGGIRWQEDEVQVENVPLSRWPLLGYGITSWRLVERALAWRPFVPRLALGAVLGSIIGLVGSHWPSDTATSWDVLMEGDPWRVVLRWAVIGTVCGALEGGSHYDDLLRASRKADDPTA